MKKEKVLIIVTLFLFNNSCGKIDTSEISCPKLSSSSSIPVEELLKYPEVLNIDGNNFKLEPSIDLVRDSMPTIDAYPSPFLKFENRCSKVTAKIYSLINPNLLQKLPSLYIPKTLWIINKNKLVWEVNISKSNLSNIEYEVQGFGPDLQSLYPITVVVKITNNDKNYFIKKVLP